MAFMATVLLAVTLTFSDFALQVIAGAVAAAATGRVMRGGGFGLLGDLVFGIVGAVLANFVVNYFKLFNMSQYGLTGELIVAVVGSILLVVIVRLLTYHRSSKAAA